MKVVKSSPSWIKPQEMPATGALMGTPASMSASVEPQMEPCDVEPLDESTSDTTRMAYGNSSTGGMTHCSAFSTSAPWPYSRRLVLRAARASPVEYGGML